MTDQYHWSPITAGNVGAWFSLSNHLAEVDGTEEFYSTEDLAEELASSQLEPERDTWAVWDGDQMVSFGQLWMSAHPDGDGLIKASLTGGVHAEHRTQGIGQKLMGLLEDRAEEAVTERHPGKRVFFSADGGREGSSARTMLSRRGFTEARYFSHMQRLLDAEQDSAGRLLGTSTAEGVTFRPAALADEQMVLAAHTAAFRDHWGSAPPSEERWHERWTGNRARPTDSILAVDDSGTVLAYAWCAEWEDGELYFELIGTVPEARGRGLGTAVLAHALERAACSGRYHRAELSVDTESLTGATRLYERIGFTTKFVTAAMRKYSA